MKIVKAEVFVTCPGRNFVTLKITTEDGITGLGDATLNGRELSVASYLQDHLCPQLIGRDAHRIEDIWQFFYKGAYWRRGDAPRDKCTLSCAINGIHAAFHYLKKNYISGCVMTVPTG